FIAGVVSAVGDGGIPGVLRRVGGIDRDLFGVPVHVGGAAIEPTRAAVGADEYAGGVGEDFGAAGGGSPAGIGGDERAVAQHAEDIRMALRARRVGELRPRRNGAEVEIVRHPHAARCAGVGGFGSVDDHRVHAVGVVG